MGSRRPRYLPPRRSPRRSIQMHAEYLKQDEDVVIIGLAVRIAPEQAARDIPLLWQRFMQMHLPTLEPTHDVYAVYCEYERDHTGPYTMLLGTRVDAKAPVPEGLRRVVLPRGAYARFIARGDPAQALWRTWSHVWNEWERRGERRFAADFERYERAALGRDTVEAEVLVGLA
ncbi:AraC family transcriptional regulator [Corallococcus sicarius]|uniref:AraC family transcriptional regulator n=2 Tax=Corallococcus sicarius TaxID=2316726 RepID=A0A3A8NF59_9BACT|nr:AraC family transcriptional regulator [Corallococcus sicarius]